MLSVPVELVNSHGTTICGIRDGEAAAGFFFVSGHLNYFWFCVWVSLEPPGLDAREPEGAEWSPRDRDQTVP